ncbi:3'-5' exonuclease [Balneatrix alpica]|uniref:3'-5' exonuclease n=1 Tax=Balneatrix alpica TaxID=75684 RepID=A0ABV5ZG49_9GAMM|nr:3'-5' exonuclease [Balneatrix alpica]
MQIARKLRVWNERREHGQGPYAHLFERYEGDEIISLDCETTSLDPKRAEILTIGAVKIKGGKRVMLSDRLDIKLKPPKYMPAESVKIHRIRSMDLEDGVELEEALQQVLEYVGNRPILGYYVHFDLRVLDNALKPRYGFGLPNQAIELSDVYHNIIKWRYLGGSVDLRFDTIAKKLDLPILERHTALGDAITVALMYVRLTKGEALGI